MAPSSPASPPAWPKNATPTSNAASTSTDNTVTFNGPIGPPPPTPLTTALGDVTTNAFSPDAAGANDTTQFDLLGRSGYLAANGTIGFTASLKLGGSVTLSPNNAQGYWKDNGSGLKRLIRSGDAMPGTGGALLNVLPTVPVPGLNPDGVVTFLGGLRIGTGSPAVTSSNDTAMWSEVGGNGLQLLIREDDDVPGITGAKVNSFGFGCYATATTDARHWRSRLHHQDERQHHRLRPSSQ